MRLVVLAIVLAIATPARALDPADPPPPRATAAFVGLGILGSGALAVGALTLIGRGGSIAMGAAALPVGAIFHYGLGRLTGVPVGAASAAEGVLLGLATGAAGFGLGKLVGPRGDLDAISLAVIGLVVGAAVGTPLWTLLDPLDLAPVPAPAVPVGGSAPVSMLPESWSLTIAQGRF